MAERLNPAERSALLGVARAAIRDELFHDGSLPAALQAAGAFPALGVPRASFVTLKVTGGGGPPRLRGCIGTLGADAELHRGVASNARQAAFHDPRFEPLSATEWPAIAISVSVLTEPEPVAGPEAIVVGRDGVILERDRRRAVFLPDVAVEQGWDRDTLLSQLARKAGLPRDAWRDAALHVFRAESFGEDGPGGRLREEDR